MLFAPDVNPFATLSPAPADGVGLNPLLQHPSMMIHPPMLYSGYVAFTIPFAFAIGALITRRLDAEWIRATRRFALIAWAFLGFGLLLGARWSYTELGWGGYWAWDPVENAALMPWLLGTAFLHSIMVQEKRGMLKVWNACLIVGTFSMALLGHVPGPLRRAAVDPRLRQQHRRALPLGADRGGGDRLGRPDRLAARRPAIREADRLADLARVGLPGQQPAAGGADRGDLLGHLLPADLRALHRQQVLPRGALVRPLHDAAGDPAGPLHRDRAAARLAPGQLGLGEAGLPHAGDLRGGRRGRASSSRPTPPTGPGRSRSSSLPPSRWPGLVQEFWQGAAARRSISGGSLPAALLGVVSRNRRRYGGYIVHIGIAVVLIGIAASSSFQTNREVKLRPGQSTVIDGRKVTYVRPTVKRQQPGLHLRRRAAASSRAADRFTLHPTRRYFRPTGAGRLDDQRLLRRRSDSEVGLKAGLGARLLDRGRSPNISGVQRQVRAADQGFKRLRRRRAGNPAAVQSGGGDDARRRRQPEPAPDGARPRSAACSWRPPNGSPRATSPTAPPATFKVIVNPLVTWMWIGGLIALAGAADRALAARGRRRGAAPGTEVDALKEAKYREIRDAELDHAAGKLSDEDYALLDAELRREAVEILDRIEANGNGNGNDRRDREPVASADLQQQEGVEDEEDREEDRRAIQVALDHRAAAEGAAAAADAKGAREPRVFARMQEHQEDEDDGDDHLQDAEERVHGCGVYPSRPLRLVSGCEGRPASRRRRRSPRTSLLVALCRLHRRHAHATSFLLQALERDFVSDEPG